MKSFSLRTSAFAAFLLLIFLFGAAAQAQTDTFTYQGRLTDQMAAGGTSYDFEFALFDAPTSGTQIGTLTRNGVTVNNGVFTVPLNFGAGAFSGTDRYLRIGVKRSTDPAGTPYTLLTPRQQITSAPYAIRTKDATAADSLSAACVLCVTDAKIAAVSGAKVTGSVLLADSATTATTAGNVTGVVAIANGGTGSTTRKFVDLTSSETIGGTKTFSSTVAAPTFNATTEFDIGGSRALSFGVAGNGNLFAGQNAGNTNAANTGTSNSFVGTSAGAANTTGNFNSFVGASAGSNNTTGGSNSFVGSFAGQNNTTGSRNSFVGRSAGQVNTTGGDNSFVGSFAGFSNTTGGFNSFVGQSAGLSNTTGSANSFVGASAGLSNTTGGTNSFVGAGAGQNNTTGNSNSFVGQRAGISNTTGFNNTAIGQGANVGSGALTNATAIGSGAVVDTSNRIVLGRAADRVQLPGIDVGAAGDLRLCRNPTTGEIVTCLVQSPRPAGNGLTEDQPTQLEAARIDAMQRQIDEQKLIIESLRKLLCAANPTADVCKP